VQQQIKQLSGVIPKKKKSDKNTNTNPDSTTISKEDRMINTDFLEEYSNFVDNISVTYKEVNKFITEINKSIIGKTYKISHDYQKKYISRIVTI